MTARKLNEVISGKPIGDLTPTSGEYARDEAGRIFVYTPVEVREARRRHFAKVRGRSAEPFFWSVMKNVDYVVNALTPPQRGFLLLLASYIDYEGRIMRGGKPMKSGAMREVLGASKSTYYDFLDACKNHGIMTQDEDGTYRISDGFHYRGKLRKDSVTRTAIMQLREMSDYLTANDIGILYALIPHINATTNVIASNPDETDIRRVDPLSQREIAERIGISVPAFSRAMKRMRFRDDSPMFAKYETADTKGVFVNPLLFVRNLDEVDGGMRLMFRVKDDELRRKS